MAGMTIPIHVVRGVLNAHAAPIPLAHVRFIDDGGAPATLAPTVKASLEVSNRVTTQDLPAAFGDPSPDRANFKVEVEDPGVAGDTIAAANVVVRALKGGLTHTVVAGDNLGEIAKLYGVADWKTFYDHIKNEDLRRRRPDPNKIKVGDKIWVPTPHSPKAFAPDRTLAVELKRVAGTHLFRSRYLRLVVDDLDRAASPLQTVLADWDPNDENVDVLDQVVRVRYTSSSGEVVSAQATVGGPNRSYLRIAVHVVRTAPGTAGVVTTNQARRRVLKWFRRTYAQIGIAPLLLQVREVDPLVNLVSISNESGANATGGGALSFRISSQRNGVAAPVVQNVGPHAPPAGATPLATANAMAALIAAGGTFHAAVVQNPPTLEAAVLQGSADLIITDPAGGYVEVVNAVSTDASQNLTVGRVTPAAFVGFAAPGANRNWVVGSIQQRTLLQQYDTGDDRCDLFVIGAHTSGDRGQAMMPGIFYAAGRQALIQVTRSAFLAQFTMDGTDTNPYSAPHEVGHVMLDAIHATDATQLMRNGTSVDHATGGSKRYSDQPVAFDEPAINILQEQRIRASGAKALLNFS